MYSRCEPGISYLLAAPTTDPMVDDLGPETRMTTEGPTKSMPLRQRM